MSRGESSNEDSSSTRVPTSSTLTSQGLAPSLPLKLAETKSVITVLASGKSKLSEGVCHCNNNSNLNTFELFKILCRSETSLPGIT